jgi:hypothetical protein
MKRDVWCPCRLYAGSSKRFADRGEENEITAGGTMRQIIWGSDLACVYPLAIRVNGRG